jgi:hypothetical protein
MSTVSTTDSPHPGVLRVKINNVSAPDDLPYHADELVHECIRRWFREERKAEVDFMKWKLSFDTQKGNPSINACCTAYANDVLQFKGGAGTQPTPRLVSFGSVPVSPASARASSPAPHSPLVLDQEPRHFTPQSAPLPRTSTAPPSSSSYYNFSIRGSGNQGNNTTLGTGASMTYSGQGTARTLIPSSAPLPTSSSSPTVLSEEHDIVAVPLDDPVYASMDEKDFQEATVSEETYKNISWFKDGMAMSGAVVKIKQKKSTKGKLISTAATGFVVGAFDRTAHYTGKDFKAAAKRGKQPQDTLLLLMTNHHVLPDIPPTSTSITIMWDDDDEDESNRQVSVGRPDAFLLSDSLLDCTVFACERPVRNPNRKIITLSTGARDALRHDLGTYILQHPRGGTKKITFGGYVSRLLNHSDFLLHTSDTLPGSSGSPIFTGHWRLAALHMSAVPKRGKGADGVYFYVKKGGGKWLKGVDSADQLEYIANKGVLIDPIIEWIVANVGVDSLKLFDLQGESAMKFVAERGQVKDDDAEMESDT